MQKSIIVFKITPTESNTTQSELQKLTYDIMKGFEDQGEGLGYDHDCQYKIIDNDIDVKRLLTKAANTTDNMRGLAALFVDMLSAYAFNRNIDQFAREIYSQDHIDGYMREKFHTLQNNPMQLWRELDAAHLNVFFKVLINFGIHHDPNWAKQIAEACSFTTSECEAVEPGPQTKAPDLSNDQLEVKRTLAGHQPEVKLDQSDPPQGGSGVSMPTVHGNIQIAVDEDGLITVSIFNIGNNEDEIEGSGHSLKEALADLFYGLADNENFITLVTE